jgi:hypothetical protein
VAVLLLAVGAACTTSSPTPSPSAFPLPSISNGPPAGQPVRIDLGIEMSADNRVVTLRFIGGPILPATDPCFTDYAGWARPAGDGLQVAVVQLPNTPPIDQTTPVACPAVGADRAVQVTLEQPFLGAIAHDVSFGTTIPIERP